MAADSVLNGPSSSTSVTLPLWVLTQYQPPYLKGSSDNLLWFQTFVVFRLAKYTFTPAFLTVWIKLSGSRTIASLTPLSQGNCGAESIVVN